ncbi:ABC transporter substrate-binding protein [Motiliproteus sp.]|uniref:ABC transporter substrate-binding protein n=1 Tax=Motiliproteus sp. TaxID=1898955 RepID=UPI003BAA3B5B
MASGIPKLLRRLSRLFLAGVIVVAHMGAVQASDQVTLQLRWVHQFQFAGYYAALEKGYYADEGLSVEIRAAGPNRPTPLEAVVEGNAHYGVGNSGLVAAYHKGAPVVALAAILQRSPSVWLSLKSENLNTPLELARHRLVAIQLALIVAPDRVFFDRHTVTVMQLRVSLSCSRSPRLCLFTLNAEADVGGRLVE